MPRKYVFTLLHTFGITNSAESWVWEISYQSNREEEQWEYCNLQGTGEEVVEFNSH